MNYKKYFEQLIERKNKTKNSFLENRVFTYKDYYLNSNKIKNFQYNFVISAARSKVYEKDFVGFIVELLIDGNDVEMYFNQLKKYKTSIEQELNNINLNWQDKQNSNRCRIYAKYEADIEDESRWNEYIDWQINTMIKFLEVLPKYTKELKNNISIIDKLKNVLSDKMGQILKREEIIDLVLEKYPDTNRTSVIPSDYCYNRKNKGSSTTELFLYLDNANYKYVGENYKMKNDKSEINKIKNIILYGVPGVGKTYSHKKLIDMIESGKFSDNDIFSTLESHSKTASYNDAKKEDRVRFITFHQSFGYEDFIEGFRPNEYGNIELQDGVFKDFCEKAKESEKNFYFVIDEINRANISKVFGELITLIEEDKREKLSVTLPYSKEPFSIPKNLYIIGTMNSTDKSIALIDIALRRRFTFLKMSPSPELIKDKVAKKIMEDLNNKINNSILGEDYQIGHSYFMGIEDKNDLSFTCKYKIKPLLEEYFYGDKEGFDRVFEVIKDV